MESAIASLILFSVGIFAALTISHTYLEAQDQLWRSEMDRQTLVLERAHTYLTLVGTETLDSGSKVKVTLRNDGQVKLADFDQWDVVVQFYTPGIPPNDPALYKYWVHWLPYTAGTPGNLEWTVTGIYMDAATLAPEVFEPDILNPGEEIVIEARLNPFAAQDATNQIIVSSNNGVNVSGYFSR